MTDVPERRPRLWPLALGTFAIGFGSNVVTGLLPSMSAELHVGFADVGRLVSFYGIAYAISTPLVALFGERLPRRALMLTALALFAAASVATALATDYETLSVIRALSAIAAGGFTPTATVLASQLSAPAMRGQALATVFGGLTTATVVAAPAGNILGPAIGYRGVYLMTAGLAVIAFLAVMLLVDRSRLGPVDAPVPVGMGPPGVETVAPAGTSVSTPSRSPAAASGRRGLPSPLVALVLLVSMVETIAAFTVQTYASPLLTAISGADGVSLSALLLSYGVAGVLGNIAGGRMADRLGAARTLWLCFFGCTVALVLLPVAGATVLGSAIVFAAWGFLAWAGNAPLQGMLIQLAGRFGQLIVALNSSVIALGIAAGAIIGGAIIGGGATLGVAYWGAAIMGLSLVLVTFVVRNKQLAS
ncbi:Predicted arabinose efflux permease, MFS family [Agreia bicolorata]|uniref:Predicted arabinose efflux permease, MFS family n=1 Tax=Agreia bicolorata TaxID=110935 RepID=A0A1T4Y955_9MICO|nr:MFS transporter [Agreia bicolorata]SKA97811.1 Predicted arabinose efflux permease, MFS family [Agreia bicolorata]